MNIHNIDFYTNTPVWMGAALALMAVAFLALIIYMGKDIYSDNK